MAKSEKPSNLTSRINRISGQVTALQKMIKKEEDSAKILIQLKAARSAIKALENIILENYLETCLSALSSKSPSKKNKGLAELKKIFEKIE